MEKIDFKNKKVTLMGLGLLGRGIGDAVYLAAQGADLIVTDLKNNESLQDSLASLSGLTNIQYHLGEHRMEDFEDRDYIIKAAGVPLDSPYIAHARERGIPILMDEILFLHQAPKDITVIGVTGTRGKTSTTMMIYEMLQALGKRVYLGGNVRGMATVSLLDTIQAGDYVVLELSSWQLQGFHDFKVSPHIGVFTNFFDDHLNYYKNDRDAYFYDKSAIFKYQQPSDVLVTTRELEERIVAASKKVIVDEKEIPPNLLQVPGIHNRINAALALAVAQALDIKKEEALDALGQFKGVEGRLQYMGIFQGRKVYNDNNATTAEATIAALEALADQETILIMGGADKQLDMNSLTRYINDRHIRVILLEGTGSERIKDHIIDNVIGSYDTLGATVAKAFEVINEGDTILFSPAFASFNKEFKNEYERNDQFMKLVYEHK